MKTIECPFEITELDQETLKRFPELSSWVQVGPKKFCEHRCYAKVANSICDFETRSNDVWIFGYPRSGTTLIQEMTWLLGNNLDYERASQSVMDVRFPVLENVTAFGKSYEKIFNEPEKYDQSSLEIAKELAKPAWETLKETTQRRFIKTHLPLSLGPRDILNTGCKLIYLVRNPKDVCVSNYFLTRSFVPFDCQLSFEEFWERFRAGVAYSCPFFEHVNEFWQLRHHENVLFLIYEDFSKNLRRTAQTIAEFLGTKVTSQQLDQLEEHLNIENFRKNKSVNNDHLKVLGIMRKEKDNFIRNGGAGGWRNYFNQEMAEDADAWIDENLKKMGLKFPEK